MRFVALSRFLHSSRSAPCAALCPSLSLRFHGRCTTLHQLFSCRLQVDFGGTLITGSDVAAYFLLCWEEKEACSCVALGRFTSNRLTRRLLGASTKPNPTLGFTSKETQDGTGGEIAECDFLWGANETCFPDHRELFFPKNNEVILTTVPSAHLPKLRPHSRTSPCNLLSTMNYRTCMPSIVRTWDSG